MSGGTIFLHIPVYVYSVARIFQFFIVRPIKLTPSLVWFPVDQEVTARAQIIILHGHQLSAGHHYAMALIMQRCNELRHYCDTLTAALKSKHTRLLQTHQMLLCLGQVFRDTHLYTNMQAHSYLLYDTHAPFVFRPRLGVMMRHIYWPIS